ncbi:MAG TPA: hypothetical protein VNE83_08960 [Terriglobales bacterium]|nr:hypothetical protein [Terriglobales bacterium]
MTGRRWGIGCLALLAAGGWAFYQWQFGTPWRPRGVDKAYSFVWLDEPGPNDKGQWVACWHGPSADSAICRFVNQQGWLDLEGTYRTYPPSTALPDGPLHVDPGTTDLLDSVSLKAWSRTFAFIHLAGGVVLFPAAAYQQSLLKYCEERRFTQPCR